jgi:peptide-methionine (S)-S-oxide reductase
MNKQRTHFSKFLIPIVLILTILGGVYYFLSAKNMENNTTTPRFADPSRGESQTEVLSKAYFAGGCFWCMEGIFESQVGVSEAISGYA